MAERKAIEKLSEKMTRYLLVHGVSCPEVFDGKNIKDFKKEIESKLDGDPTKKCEATVGLLKCKGILA